MISISMSKTYGVIAAVGSNCCSAVARRHLITVGYPARNNRLAGAHRDH